MAEDRATLDELLDDPMIEMVMARDGWRRDQVRMLLSRAGERGADEPAVPPAHMIEACRARWMCV